MCVSLQRCPRELDRRAARPPTPQETTSQGSARPERLRPGPGAPRARGRAPSVHAFKKPSGELEKTTERPGRKEQAFLYTYRANTRPPKIYCLTSNTLAAWEASCTCIACIQAWEECCICARRSRKLAYAHQNRQSTAAAQTKTAVQNKIVLSVLLTSNPTTS